MTASTAGVKKPARRHSGYPTHLTNWACEARRVDTGAEAPSLVSAHIAHSHPFRSQVSFWREKKDKVKKLTGYKQGRRLLCLSFFQGPAPPPRR